MDSHKCYYIILLYCPVLAQALCILVFMHINISTMINAAQALIIWAQKNKLQLDGFSCQIHIKRSDQLDCKDGIYFPMELEKKKRIKHF